MKFPSIPTTLFMGATIGTFIVASISWIVEPVLREKKLQKQINENGKGR